MEDILYIGQWQGFFTYGPEYGKIIHGKEAEFRLFIESYSDGEFSGRIIDWEGLGINGEVSVVHGSLNNNIIEFTKEYPHSFIIDQWGHSTIDSNQPGHTVMYEGIYDPAIKCFLGSWKILKTVIANHDSVIKVVGTGSWRMSTID